MHTPYILFYTQYISHQSAYRLTIRLQRSPPRDRWGSTSAPWVRKYAGFMAVIGTGLSRSYEKAPPP